MWSVANVVNLTEDVLYTGSDGCTCFQFDPTKLSHCCTCGDVVSDNIKKQKFLYVIINILEGHNDLLLSLLLLKFKKSYTRTRKPQFAV